MDLFKVNKDKLELESRCFNNYYFPYLLKKTSTHPSRLPHLFLWEKFGVKDIN